MQARERQSQTARTRNESLAFRNSNAEEVVLDGREKDASVKDVPVTASSEMDVAEEYKSYQALIERTIDVFGDDLIASRWLSAPSSDLNGQIPLEVARKLRYQTSELNKVFEPIFIRIEHGIYG